MTAQYEYLIDTGEVVADTADVLADVQAEYRAATNRPNLNLSAATPQGSLAAAEATARVNVMKTAAERANVINPQLSFGTYLDAVCAFNGIPRGANLSTTARNVRVYGNVGAEVPAGYRVRTPAGDYFTIITTTVIPVQGTTMLSIKSEAFGDIALPIGTLTIVDGSPGWGSIEVTAQTIRTPGTIKFTDAQMKNSRNSRLALQGMGNSAAIVARVLGVPNVTSVSVVENNTGATGVINGVTFSRPNAFWVCVAGNPDMQAVADALYDAHSGGCPWDFGGAGNGIPVGTASGMPARDPVTGVSYFVRFTTPILYDTYINVIVKQGASASSPEEAVRKVLIDYSQGLLEGEAGYVVGASVSAFEAAGAIGVVLPGLYVRSVLVACVPAGSPAPAYPADYSTEFELTPFQQAQLAIGNIRVEIQP